MCLRLLCYFTFLRLIDLLLIHYILWKIAKDFLVLEWIAGSRHLATFALLQLSRLPSWERFRQWLNTNILKKNLWKWMWSSRNGNDNGSVLGFCTLFDCVRHSCCWPVIDCVKPSSWTQELIEWDSPHVQQ